MPDLIRLPGSAIPIRPGSTRIDRVDPSTVIDISVYLRPRAGQWMDPDLVALGSIPISERTHLTREQLAAERGADPDDIAALQAYAHEHGFTIVASAPGARRFRLRSDAATMERAFDITLETHTSPTGEYRYHADDIALPGDLASAIVGVLGLAGGRRVRPRPETVPGGSGVTPPQVAASYAYPPNNGAGQCVAIVAVFGSIQTADMTQFFGDLGLPLPHIDTVSVDTGFHFGGDDTDLELTLDLAVAASVANGAHFVVYDSHAFDEQQGMTDAISTAISDGVNGPSVVSISFGAIEDQVSAGTVAAMEQVLTDAALAGVTVCVSTGDSGSAAEDGSDPGQAVVNYPASSPQVIAVGGTALVVNGTTISGEVGWPGSTGGASLLFPLPSWQAGIGVPATINPGGGRGLPDMAAAAFPGYPIIFQGRTPLVGGTSASAPMIAALIAIGCAWAGRPLGFVNPLLYTEAANTFRDITSGSNGAFSAGPGWDAVTGWGVPNGSALLQRLVPKAHLTVTPEQITLGVPTTLTITAVDPISGAVLAGAAEVFYRDGAIIVEQGATWAIDAPYAATFATVFDRGGTIVGRTGRQPSVLWPTIDVTIPGYVAVENVVRFVEAPPPPPPPPPPAPGELIVACNPPRQPVGVAVSFEVTANDSGTGHAVPGEVWVTDTAAGPQSIGAVGVSLTHTFHARVIRIPGTPHGSARIVYPDVSVHAIGYPDTVVPIAFP